eukprot:105187-Hanusia_phi.AAC.1
MRLAESLGSCPFLERLDLRRNGLSEDAAGAVAGSESEEQHKELQGLEEGGGGGGGGGGGKRRRREEDWKLIVVVEVMQQCSQLKSLDVSMNWFGAEGARDLARALSSSCSIRHLLL